MRLVTWFACAGTLLLLAAAGAAGQAAAMRFGMDPGAVGFLASQGAKPDYAAYWAGPWNERAGWGYLGAIADGLADQGVQPVVEWYYWGASIGPGCVQDGCWEGGHWRSRAQWNADAARLADALHAGLKGRPGVLVLETEFNKNGIATWEAFDGYLADHARIFRARAPELKLVLGFGNWQPEHWGRFDRAAAAVDMVGFQTMRASTRDSSGSYLDAVDAVASATKRMKATFGKPVLLHDLALSSYREPTWGVHQERVVKELFARAGELRGAGLTGVVYRALDDDPTFTTKEYYGVGERHMGLRSAWGSWKPALDDWVRGVKAVRSGPTPAPAATGATSTSGFDASFAPRAVGNDWWVEAKVTANQALSKVEARVGDGAWKALPPTAWGTHAASFHVPDGSRVLFRATSVSGATDAGGATTWW